MDRLSQTHVRIRRPASSAVYKAALRPGIIAAFGFLVETRHEWVSPVFDAALLSCVCGDGFRLEDVARTLEDDLGLCRALASGHDAEPLAVFAAWEKAFRPDRSQRLGFIVDATRELRLPYLAVFPVDGGETLWRTRIYFVNRFPHDPLPYSALGRRSDRPEHNPRRMKAAWARLKEGCDSSIHDGHR